MSITTFEGRPQADFELSTAQAAGVLDGFVDFISVSAISAAAEARKAIVGKRFFTHSKSNRFPVLFQSKARLRPAAAA
jgi:hypothetical protein